MDVAKQEKVKGRKFANPSEVKKVMLESVRSRIRDGAVVHCATDNSDRGACDTVRNYKEHAIQ